MASTVFVVDSSFKRTQVKVTPGKYLREILEDACKSRKWNAEEYTLKSQNNKTLDLSQPFRLSGLTAGAKLQLTQASRSPSVVSVALQLPVSERGGARLQDKFPSTTSLWLVLRKFEDGVAGSAEKLNLTQRGAPSSGSGAGRLVYEQPCLHVMGRNFETFADLQKSLGQLGLNGGSVGMKLSFTSIGQPLEEAMQEISQYFSSADTAHAESVGSSSSRTAHGAHASADGTVESTSDTLAEADAARTDPKTGPRSNDHTPVSDAPPATVASHDMPASSSESQPHLPPSETPQQPPPPPPSSTINGITVYAPPTSSTPFAALQPDDPTVFEPTIDHAKAHQAALQRSGQNKRLLSDKELEEQEATQRERLALVHSVTIRVRYPDQSMSEMTFSSSETAADLYNKVMDTLAAAPEPFELKYTGSKGHQTLPNNSSKRLVRDFGFRGKVLVTLVWAPEASIKARQSPSLKPEYRSRATELKVELASQQKEGEEAHRVAMQRPEPREEGGGGGKGGGGKGDLEAKMKKFLGFGKK